MRDQAAPEITAVVAEHLTKALDEICRHCAKNQVPPAEATKALAVGIAWIIHHWCDMFAKDGLRDSLKQHIAGLVTSYSDTTNDITRINQGEYRGH